MALHFDKKKAQPGDNVNVVVTADPNSLVNLLAVDQSVLLLKSGNDVTSDQVGSGLYFVTTYIVKYPKTINVACSR